MQSHHCPAIKENLKGEKMNFIALDGRHELNRSQDEKDEGSEVDYRFHLGADVCPFLPPSLFLFTMHRKRTMNRGSRRGRSGS